MRLSRERKCGHVAALLSSRALLAAASWLVGCGGLPEPSLPLSPTPDAEFRKVPPQAEGLATPAVPPVERFTLMNGLNVYVVTLPGYPLISVRYASRRARSSSDAVDTQFAMASLLAATPELGSFRVRRNEGASWFAAEVSPRDLPAALSGLGKSLAHPRFDSQFLRSLRSHKKTLDSLSSRYGAQFRAVSYVVRQILSPDDSRGAAANSASGEFDDQLRARLTPRVSALIISGDVHRAELEPLIRSVLDISAPPPEPEGSPTNTTRPHREQTIGLIDVPALQPVVAVATSAPALEASDAPAFAVLGELVAGSRASRLFRRVRLDSGASYGVNASWTVDDRVFSLFVYAAPESVEDVTENIVAELERARHEAPSEDELTVARTVLLEELAERFETPSGAADMVSAAFMRRSTPEYWNAFASGIANVDANAVRRAAQRYWHPSDRAIAIAGPAGWVQAALQWTRLRFEIVPDEP